MTHRVASQALSTEVKAEDVLAALSAFPTPPNHIPASPSVSSNGGSHFSLSQRERDVPPSSFARSKGVLTRRDSDQSEGSTNSAHSGKLSARVNGRDAELGLKGGSQRNRDSASGSSASSTLVVNDSNRAMLPSPMSGRSYYTAPNSPLPFGAPRAGTGSASGDTDTAPRTRSSSSSSLATPSSAYPASTSSASAYPYYSPSSAYPYSPASGTRYIYPNPSNSARTALAVISATPTSTSSSPSSMHVPVSAVGMSPIAERDERERDRERLSQATRRQSSVPRSSSRRETRRGRSKAESESGSEIGSPPSMPLPPIPSTSKVGDSAASADATPRGGPPSIKSLPSLRSGRKSTSSQIHAHMGHHGKQESGVSIISTGSGVSAFSATAPSLAEFGVAMKSRAEYDAETQGNRREPVDDRPKSRARATRTVALPLRIEIPPTPTQDVRRERSQTIERPLGSGSSLTSPLPRELGGSRALRERVTEGGDKLQSPTGSLFSIASGATKRSSGMSTAQCLRTRVSGILEGLEDLPGAIPPATTPIKANLSPYTSGTGGGLGGTVVEEEKTRRLHIAASSKLYPSTNPVKMSRKPSGSVDDGNDHLPTENLARDPSAAQTLSPATSGKDGRAVPSPSPVDWSSNGTHEDATVMYDAQSISQVPPLSDVETDKEEVDKTDGDPRVSSESLLGQFPSIPVGSRPPPSSFPFTSGSHVTPGRTSTSTPSSSGNGVYRTVSQSRRKPLPPAPRLLSESLSSITSRESDAAGATRGRAHVGRSASRDGGLSPDIETMMNKTPRPVYRSKSLSARSGRSSRSLSTRSSSIKSTNGERKRPSLPDENERQRALSRFSAVSSSSSAPASRNSGLNREGLPARRSAGSEFTDSYGGIEEEDADATADYGVAIARHRGAYDLSPSPSNFDEFGLLRESRDAGDFYTEEAEAMLRDTTADGSLEEEESDSDIDLHTPLPHILLREGVLSPNSKVLASMSSGSISTRSSLIGTGRDSVASYATNASFGSVLTKSGLYKDERDTEKRRRRHRDGKLLKEGLGLTTGLGWSDSEDEDAPSPFTNRVKSMTLSRNTSMASLRSRSSSKSQLFSRSTPPSEVPSRILSTLSEHPPLPSSLNSRRPMRKSEPHPSSKSLSTVNLTRGVSSSQGKQARRMTNGGSMSPTSPDTPSIPFPPSTSRADLGDGSEESLPHSVSTRNRATSRASSGGARTPTVSSLRPKQSASSLRAPSIKSAKSVPATRSALTASSTPRPLRLPALQQQKSLTNEYQQTSLKLQPGQPEPGAGAILGYNRNLHDRQRTQYLAAPKSAPAHPRPVGSASPTLSHKSLPSGLTMSSTRRAYGSVPSTPSLHSPSARVSSTHTREPSPSRLSASTNGLGKPRTGTGMVYHQSSIPVGTAI